MYNSSKLGIILAGGIGTRLYPLSNYINKHLLPVYDKPMLDYSLSPLILMGIKKILIVSDLKTIKNLKKRYGNGKFLNINIKYSIQEKPNGIPEIFKLESKYISNFKKICLMLGDNFFYGSNLTSFLKTRFETFQNSEIFTYKVKNTWDYGILELDKNGNPKKIIEKPFKTSSNLAITGMYFFNNKVINRIKEIKPSSRGELEITDLIKIYLKQKELSVSVLPRGTTWYDAGSPKRLLELSEFVRHIEERQGYKIHCLEEIALRIGLINKKNYKILISNYPKSEYKDYLNKLINEEV